MGTPLLGGPVCGPSGYFLDERALDRSDRAADAVIGELATLGEDRLTDLISDMISDAICDARVERDDITDGDFVAIEDAARRRLIKIMDGGLREKIAAALPTLNDMAFSALVYAAKSANAHFQALSEAGDLSVTSAPDLLSDFSLRCVTARQMHRALRDHGRFAAARRLLLGDAA